MSLVIDTARFGGQNNPEQTMGDDPQGVFVRLRHAFGVPTTGDCIPVLTYGTTAATQNYLRPGAAVHTPSTIPAGFLPENRSTRLRGGPGRSHTARPSRSDARGNRCSDRETGCPGSP